MHHCSSQLLLVLVMDFARDGHPDGFGPNSIEIETMRMTFCILRTLYVEVNQGDRYGGVPCLALVALALERGVEAPTKIGMCAVLLHCIHDSVTTLRCVRRRRQWECIMIVVFGFRMSVQRHKHEAQYECRSLTEGRKGSSPDRDGGKCGLFNNQRH
jgi:hypothetical protein